jgi:hypothetical protein
MTFFTAKFFLPLVVSNMVRKTEQLWFDSQEGGEILIFFVTFIWAVMLNDLPVQLVPGKFILG